MTTIGTIKVMGEDYPDRICDSCEQIIESQGHLHWPDKDFDLCYDCLMSHYQRVFDPFTKNEPKPFIYKKNPIPNDIRWKIWRRDDFTCQYCGIKENLFVDHIIPESQGGELIDSNLVTACKSCNSKKSNRTPEEAGMKILNDPRI